MRGDGVFGCGKIGLVVNIIKRDWWTFEATSWIQNICVTVLVSNFMLSKYLAFPFSLPVQI